MEKIKLLIFMAVLLITACNSNNSNVDTKAEADKLRALEDEWTAALQVKDIEKCLSFVSDDFVNMEADNPIAFGKEILKKNYEKSFADSTILWNTFSWKNESVDVSASGDLAFVRGSRTLKFKTLAGEVEVIEKAVDIFKKIDGQWKTVQSIGNADKDIPILKTSPELVAEFTKIEDGWNQAGYNHDAKALDLIFATEYVSIGETGAINKQQELANAASGKLKLSSPAVVSEIKVNSYGTITIVTGLNTAKGTYDGKDISGSYYFVDVFVQRDGRWQCVSTQGTKKK